MARPIKDKWLGARVDEALYVSVDSYVKTVEISMGDLLRLAVEEYLNNHPVKIKQEA